ncbi:MAG: hypothetical protein U9Q12_04590 [Patescibacteria group bacterium]|nr:hypothetical protein [Patescibacteria group bacterium]
MVMVTPSYLQQHEEPSIVQECQERIRKIPVTQRNDLLSRTDNMFFVLQQADTIVSDAGLPELKKNLIGILTELELAIRGTNIVNKLQKEHNADTDFVYRLKQYLNGLYERRKLLTA